MLFLITCFIWKRTHSNGLMQYFCRVFFPYVPMDEFRYAVEMVLNVPVLTLTDDEEHAFIQFYGLPTSKLKCKKAIKLFDFSHYLPQLKYMYKERTDGDGPGMGTPKGSFIASLLPSFLSGGIGAAIRTKSSPSKSVHNDMSGGYGPSTMASNALKNLMDNKSKRAADPPPAHSAPPKKKAKKRLDDMVNRLWSKNQSSSTLASTNLNEVKNSGTVDSENRRETIATPATTAIVAEALDHSIGSDEEQTVAKLGEIKQAMEQEQAAIATENAKARDTSSQRDERVSISEDLTANTDDANTTQEKPTEGVSKPENDAQNANEQSSSLENDSNIKQTIADDDAEVATATNTEDVENLTKPKEDAPVNENVNVNVDKETCEVFSDTILSEVANKDEVGIEDTGSSIDEAYIVKDNPADEKTSEMLNSEEIAETDGLKSEETTAASEENMVDDVATDIEKSTKSPIEGTDAEEHTTVGIKDAAVSMDVAEDDGKTAKDGEHLTEKPCEVSKNGAYINEEIRDTDLKFQETAPVTEENMVDDVGKDIEKSTKSPIEDTNAEEDTTVGIQESMDVDENDCLTDKTENGTSENKESSTTEESGIVAENKETDESVTGVNLYEGNVNIVPTDSDTETITAVTSEPNAGEDHAGDVIMAGVEDQERTEPEPTEPFEETSTIEETAEKEENTLVTDTSITRNTTITGEEDQERTTGKPTEKFEETSTTEETTEKEENTVVTDISITRNTTVTGEEDQERTIEEPTGTFEETSTTEETTEKEENTLVTDTSITRNTTITGEEDQERTTGKPTEKFEETSTTEETTEKEENTVVTDISITRNTTVTGEEDQERTIEEPTGTFEETSTTEETTEKEENTLVTDTSITRNTTVTGEEDQERTTEKPTETLEETSTTEEITGKEETTANDTISAVGKTATEDNTVTEDSSAEMTTAEYEKDTTGADEAMDIDTNTVEETMEVIKGTNDSTNATESVDKAVEQNNSDGNVDEKVTPEEEMPTIAEEEPAVTEVQDNSEVKNNSDSNADEKVAIVTPEEEMPTIAEEEPAVTKIQDNLEGKPESETISAIDDIAETTAVNTGSESNTVAVEPDGGKIGTEDVVNEKVVATESDAVETSGRDNLEEDKNEVEETEAVTGDTVTGSASTTTTKEEIAVEERPEAVDEVSSDVSVEGKVTVTGITFETNAAIESPKEAKKISDAKETTSETSD